MKDLKNKTIEVLRDVVPNEEKKEYKKHCEKCGSLFLAIWRNADLAEPIGLQENGELDEEIAEARVMAFSDGYVYLHSNANDPQEKMYNPPKDFWEDWVDEEHPAVCNCENKEAGGK